MNYCIYFFFFFFSSRRRHTRSDRDWSSDVCSSDLDAGAGHVPSIRQQQDLRSAMQGAESLAFSRLSFYFSHLLFPVVIKNKRPRVLHPSWVPHFSWVLREVGRLS